MYQIKFRPMLKRPWCVVHTAKLLVREFLFEYQAQAWVRDNSHLNF